MATMTIEQREGRRRRVELEGRGLPFAAGVKWGGEQRMESVWLPGSPSGVAQIFGAKPRDFPIGGRWGDRDMVGAGAQCVVRIDGRQYGSALEAARVLDVIRKEGIEVRVAYEGEVRYGILREWSYGPFAEGRTLDRIDWEARFEWLSEDGAPQAPGVPPRIGIQDLAGTLGIIAQQAATVEGRITGVADAILEVARTPVTRIRELSQQAAQTAQAWSQRAAEALSTAEAAAGLAAEVLAAGAETASAARSMALSQAAAIQAAGERTSSVGSIQTDADLGDQLVVAREALSLQALGKELQALGDRAYADTTTALYDLEPQVTYARAGEDLRAIAFRTLGTRDGWRDVALANGIQGSAVEPGRELLLPRGVRSLLTT